jgi:hypothetical protein
MSARSAAAVVLAACALAAAGCTERDAAGAETAVRDFLAAVERGDGERACRRLTEAGVAELLLAARQGRSAAPPSEPGPRPACAHVVEGVPAERRRLGALRRAPVERSIVEGDRATVETAAGSYELEEVRGSWRVSRFAPAARVLRGDDRRERPVLLRTVRPAFTDPALGESAATETDDEELEIHGAVEPPDARVGARLLRGGTLERITAGDGRWRLRLRPARGDNAVALTARAPGRSDATLVLRVRRR